MEGGKKETMAEFFANDRDVNSQRQRIWAALEVPLSSTAKELVSRDGFCGYVPVQPHSHSECLRQTELPQGRRRIDGVYASACMHHHHDHQIQACEPYGLSFWIRPER